jgi:CheY-like chemotaxis protein
MTIKGKRIFVVEDDANNLAIVSTILQGAGATVYFSRRGMDVATKIRAVLPINIILMDLMLSDKMTGYDVLALIRARPELAAIPVIAVTAADPTIEIAKAKEKGFNGYISKPIRMHTFSRFIDNAINGEPVWSPE